MLAVSVVKHFRPTLGQPPVAGANAASDYLFAVQRRSKICGEEHSIPVREAYVGVALRNSRAEIG
jgi:hypothetical protein